ncbi:MAG: YdeI/OmpD-associated family protein [Archangium sp.]
MSKTFKTKVGALDKGNLALIELPFDAKEAFGKARAPVVVTLNGQTTWRTTVAVYDGKHYIGARKEIREQTEGFEAGKVITVEIAFDDQPREVEVPPELKKCLVGKIATAWKKLSFSHQREWCEAITDAKKAETKDRRLNELLAKLA